MGGSIEMSVGSERAFKVELAKKFLDAEFRDENINASAYNIESKVSETPTSIPETVAGAENRAQEVLEQNPQAHFGVGLEGGTYEEEGILYLVEAAAISINIGEGNCYTESGVSNPVALPQEIRDAFESGEFLSTITQQYPESQGVEVTIEDIQKNGTAYYFTQPPITRNEMMTQALEVAMEKLDEGLEAK